MRWTDQLSCAFCEKAVISVAVAEFQIRRFRCGGASSSGLTSRRGMMSVAVDCERGGRAHCVVPK